MSTLDVQVLAEICKLLGDGDVQGARALASSPEKLPQSVARSSWTKQRLLQRFLVDGFTDRYSGAQLVFPGTLRALSCLLPDEFPYHRNWKQGVTHPVYWSLYPTIDHVQPVARGGPDDEANVVTTSMLKNAAKGNWLLAELGWSRELAPVWPGWDGLVGVFATLYETQPVLRDVGALREWYQALRRVT